MKAGKIGQPIALLLFLHYYCCFEIRNTILTFFHPFLHNVVHRRSVCGDGREHWECGEKDGVPPQPPTETRPVGETTPESETGQERPVFLSNQKGLVFGA